MFQIAPHTRLRRSPYFDATVAEGVTTFSTYNHMLMPMGYGDPEAEYWRILRGASMWDVACERQVQISGPDAARLAQILVPRDLSRCDAGQGKYVAVCSHDGALINDPILLKLDGDRFWLSIADSDIFFWARAIAAERKLRAEVCDPGVSPLAVQGPKAEEVIVSVFGERARALKYFHFMEARVENIPLLLARSGWSKQGGFELYLTDETKGVRLWNIIREAGRPWDIGPGNPNPCERIESGLLSWGGDTDAKTNPFEVRMEKYVDLHAPGEVVGISALRRIHSEGAKRRQLGVVLEGDSPAANHPVWMDISRDGEKIGDMTNGVWSRRLKRMIGFALVKSDSAPGEKVSVRKDGKQIPGELTELPFC